VGLAWAVLLGFVRLMTHPAVLERPMSAGEALGHARSWLARPNALVLQPGPRHLDLLDALLAEAGAAAALTTDAHLAALAIENNAVLHSNDADFARFGGLRRHDPLDSSRRRP
jgi:toxin-antitoxin system PIN domain toxin